MRVGWGFGCNLCAVTIGAGGRNRQVKPGRERNYFVVTTGLQGGFQIFWDFLEGWLFWGYALSLGVSYLI
jgi:hypothetical protein